MKGVVVSTQAERKAKAKQHYQDSKITAQERYQEKLLELEGRAQYYGWTSKKELDEKTKLAWRAKKAAALTRAYHFANRDELEEERQRRKKEQL